MSAIHSNYPLLLYLPKKLQEECIPSLTFDELHNLRRTCEDLYSIANSQAQDLWNKLEQDPMTSRVVTQINTTSRRESTLDKLYRLCSHFFKQTELATVRPLSNLQDNLREREQKEALLSSNAVFKKETASCLSLDDFFPD